MGSGIYVATAGAVAQSNALDVTASNIANGSTAGFQGARVSFRQALASAQSVDTAMVSVGTGGVDTSSGTIAQTGNPLDLALNGDGYFAVDTSRGVRYTRDGAFKLDDSGKLTTADGLAVKGNVDGKPGPIMIPHDAQTIQVDSEGHVSADGKTVGQITVVKLDNTSTSHDGDNLVKSSKEPLKDPPPQIVPGAIEGSNVNVLRGVVDLVKVSRTYESLMKVIEGYHEIESRAASELGKPR